MNWPRLKCRWIPIRKAKAYVAEHHRHLKKIQGAVFALGCFEGDRLCGVATVGRPIARRKDDGQSFEITRCATDGTPNACSCLYAACRRVAQAMGIGKLETKTLREESGGSLKSVAKPAGESEGGEWCVPSRPREKVVNADPKQKWRLL